MGWDELGRAGIVDVSGVSDAAETEDGFTMRARLAEEG